jgi:hypothetical protein
VSFYILWLLDIVPSMLNNTIPKKLAEVGLFTNPVQVIDLSIFLPRVFITGVLLLKNNSIGHLLTPIILVFFILMDLTIAVLTIAMVKGGVGSSYSIAIIMSLLAIFSSVLFIQNNKEIKISS